MIDIKDPNRFAEVRAAILRGDCPPSTGQLKKTLSHGLLHCPRLFG